MNFLGLTITRKTKALLNPIDSREGWRTVFRINEPYTGAWQQNVSIDYDLAVSFHALFACITLIASDFAKMRLKLVKQDDNDIWQEFENAAWSPVIRKPNNFQNRIQFFENWMTSKLTKGNTYVLKVRDQRNVVVKLFVLNPDRVRVLVAENGEVFYELAADNIANVAREIVIPASEIIHDRFNCLFHPLVGLSPIFAAGLAAIQGLNIQNDSASFFGNKSSPGGILMAPGRISQETATELKEYWETNFSGENRGKLAVVGDGLKYQALTINPEDAQLIEQLKYSSDVVCSAFHVPPYKIGMGTLPATTNIQALNIEYMNEGLGRLIEDAELCLDEGLELPARTGTEFDTEVLLRMDTPAQVQSSRDAIGAGFLSPNEARKKFDLSPVEGGDSPYLQQQNFSLAALAKRDAKDDPFAKADPFGSSGSQPANDNEPDDDAEDDEGDAQAAAKEFNSIMFDAQLAKGAENAAR